MGKLVEVVIESLKVSLTNSQRVVVLYSKEVDRYLPIWIGPYEAEAITIALQEVQVARPLTHDLLLSTFRELHASLVQIEIHTLRNDVYYARIRADVNDTPVEVDARPSDAIALALRAHIPMFADTEVLEKAGIRPDPDIYTAGEPSEEIPDEQADIPAAEAGSLSLFEDYINKLNLGNSTPGEDAAPGDDDK